MKTFKLQLHHANCDEETYQTGNERPGSFCVCARRCFEVAEKLIKLTKKHKRI
jgi:hypothetical protein